MIYILYHYALSALTPLYCGDSRHRHPLNPGRSEAALYTAATAATVTL